MEATTYHFKVGEVDCIAISDGHFTYTPPRFPPPPVALFASAPAADLAVVLRRHGIEPDDWHEWTSPYICLLLRVDGRNILIDTGAGDLGPHTGRLVERLAQEGIGPDDIDLIVLTHGHPDHLGGNTDGAGGLRFSDAEWVMSEREWEFWMHGEAEHQLPEHSKDVLLGFANRNLSVLKDHIRLIEGEQEIAPGVSVIPAPGHTPGQVAVRVSSAGESLLCISDLVLHPIHAERREWVSIFDMLPAELASTRGYLLNRAAAQDALVMAFHLPFPGLGRIARGPEGVHWAPVT